MRTDIWYKQRNEGVVVSLTFSVCEVVFLISFKLPSRALYGGINP